MCEEYNEKSLSSLEAHSTSTSGKRLSSRPHVRVRLKVNEFTDFDNK